MRIYFQPLDEGGNPIGAKTEVHNVTFIPEVNHDDHLFDDTTKLSTWNQTVEVTFQPIHPDTWYALTGEKPTLKHRLKYGWNKLTRRTS